MRIKTRIWILLFIGILSNSCDPSYPISIKNSTGAEIIVDAKITDYFDPGLTTTYITDENNRLEFTIQSGHEFYCGYTLGGLKYDLPFSELKIYTQKDTIVAENRNEVLKLFDKKWTGYLKTPYVLTVN